MRRSRVIGWTLLALCVAAVCAYAYKAHRYSSAFAETEDGDSLDTVVMRFGSEPILERPSAPFLRYATEGCKSPCSTRLWWEDPLLRGIVAWSVELDAQGLVIHKAHWVSP